MRRGAFVFEHSARETVAVEHSHAHLVAKLFATGQGLGRCLRCQQGAEFLGCSRLGLRDRRAECEYNERGNARKSHVDSLVDGWGTGSYASRSRLLNLLQAMH